MKTHDYTICSWGHNCEVSSIKDGGHTISLHGWGKGIQDGDFILLKNGEDSTRYKISDIKYKFDPHDMWFATAIFAPRDK